MFKRHIRPAGGLLAAVALAAGCAGSSGQAAQRTPAPVAAQGEAAAIARARADSVRHPYTEADIQFMTGMIAHHAQAIVMAGWAPTHGASPEVRTLCARILNAQRDEIRTMQNWLRDRNQPVPEPTGRPMAMDMPGMAHDTLMPGMLNAAQLDTLDAARGHDFDVYFLRYMIQHHTGAIEMVKQLFGSYGAAEDELTFKLASDINVDQTTEVARMQKLLASLVIGVSIQ